MASATMTANLTPAQAAFRARIEYVRYHLTQRWPDGIVRRLPFPFSTREAAERHRDYLVCLYGGEPCAIIEVKPKALTADEQAEADDRAFMNEIVERELNGEYTGVQL